MKKIIKNIFVVYFAEGNNEMPYPEAKNATDNIILLFLVAFFFVAYYYGEPVNHGSLFDPAISSQDLNAR